VALGLATGVKWSGLYLLAGAGILVVASDAALRRRAGIELWLSGAILKQGPVAFLLLVPLALAVYVATWAGWFATDGGYSRHWIEDGGTAWVGGLAWVPDWFQNWWHYQALMYGYHVNEDTPHGYMAPAWTWLLLIRPTSMQYTDLG